MQTEVFHCPSVHCRVYGNVIRIFCFTSLPERFWFNIPPPGRAAPRIPPAQSSPPPLQRIERVISLHPVGIGGKDFIRLRGIRAAGLERFRKIKLFQLAVPNRGVVTFRPVGIQRVLQSSYRMSRHSRRRSSSGTARASG